MAAELAPVSSSSLMVTKLPRLFDIFSPSTCRKPLCIQVFAIAWVPWAQRDWAISFSWCGKTRSMPPPWMSKVFFRGPQVSARSSSWPSIRCASRGGRARDAGGLGQPARRLRGLPQHEVHRPFL
jgi:hypothetical protein